VRTFECLLKNVVQKYRSLDTVKKRVFTFLKFLRWYSFLFYPFSKFLKINHTIKKITKGSFTYFSNFELYYENIEKIEPYKIRIYFVNFEKLFRRFRNHYTFFGKVGYFWIFNKFSTLCKVLSARLTRKNAAGIQAIAIILSRTILLFMGRLLVDQMQKMINMLTTGKFPPVTIFSQLKKRYFWDFFKSCNFFFNF